MIWPGTVEELLYKKAAYFVGNCSASLKNLAIGCSVYNPDHRLDINEIVSQFENMPNNSLPPPPQPADKLVY